jgi:hypothetical protein
MGLSDLDWQAGLQAIWWEGSSNDFSSAALAKEFLLQTLMHDVAIAGKERQLYGSTVGQLCENQAWLSADSEASLCIFSPGFGSHLATSDPGCPRFDEAKQPSCPPSRRFWDPAVRREAK